MTLNQLEYFAAVAETLSFTKAAEHCYISQAAITMQIRALEQELGAELFLRSKHHVEITTAGAVFLKEAREILARVEESKKAVRTVAEGITGELTIGFIRGYEKSSFSTTVREFREAFPNIRLNFIRDNSKPLLRSFQEKKCDLVFNLSMYRPENESCGSLFIRSYPLFLAVNRANPLAKLPAVRYRDLVQESFFIMQPEGRSSDETEEALLCYERGGFMPNIAGHEEEPDMMIFRASISEGVGVLPEYAIRDTGRIPNVVFVPLVKADGSAETLDLDLLWDSGSSNPSLGHFLSWISGMFGKK